MVVLMADSMEYGRAARWVVMMAAVMVGTTGRPMDSKKELMMVVRSADWMADQMAAQMAAQTAGLKAASLAELWDYRSVDMTAELLAACLVDSKAGQSVAPTVFCSVEKLAGG